MIVGAMVRKQVGFQFIADSSGMLAQNDRHAAVAIVEVEEWPEARWERQLRPAKQTNTICGDAVY